MEQEDATARANITLSIWRLLWSGKVTHPGLWRGGGVRLFASANDTPPYRKVRERVGHPVRGLSWD